MENSTDFSVEKTVQELCHHTQDERINILFDVIDESFTTWEPIRQLILLLVNYLENNGVLDDICSNKK